MADYSINAVTRRVVFTGSAGVGPYAFSFEVLAQTDIAVYKNATKLTLTTHYTVTINANGTGSVTLVSAATGTDKITIIGSRAIERTTDFVTAGDLLASSLNEQLDSQIVMIQQLAEENRRTLKAPAYDPAAIEDGGALNMTLPPVATRAGNVLAFDASGNPIATEAIGEWKGNWATATSFAVRDIVKDSSNSNVYLCITAHTSTGTTPISSNAGVGNWALVVEAATATASASAAAASAATATTQASNASASAATASTQATNAAASAASATSSATSATSSATSALASYNSFRGQYYGNLSANPTLDPLGNAIGTGDLYFNTTSNVMFVYSGSAWVAAYASSGGAMLGTNNLSDLASVSSARTNLGLGALATATSATVAQGGTGQTTLTANAVLIGNGTSAVAAIAPSTAGNVLTSDGTNWNSTAVASAAPTGSYTSAANTTSTYTVFMSGTGTVATAYFAPVYTIPTGSLITITGVTPSGYNTSLATVTASSTTSFSCTGSISGTTLTALSVTGTITVGAVLVGNAVLAGTIITAGSGSSWTVSVSQTTSSTTITGSCGVVSYANTTTGAQTVSGAMVVTPSGYLVCDGSVYNRSAYPTLAAYIGSPLVGAAATYSATSPSGGYPPGAPVAANGYMLIRGTATAISNFNQTASANAIGYSTDGITFTQLSGFNLTGGATQANFVYNNGVYAYAPYQFYTAGAGTAVGIIYGSSVAGMTTKGTVFTAPSGLLGAQGNLVAGGTSNVFVASFYTFSCCGSGTNASFVYSSTSGATGTWSAVTLPGITAGTLVYGAGYSGGIVLYYQTKVWYSATGTGTYTDISSNFTLSGGQVYSISYANGQFILVSGKTVYVSLTGASGSWTLLTTTGGPNIGGGVFWNGTFYAIGYLISQDLKSWSNSPSVSLYPYAYPSAVIGTKFFANGNLNIVTWGALSYSSTQFPIPSASGTTAASGPSGVTPIATFIKT